MHQCLRDPYGALELHSVGKRVGNVWCLGVDAWRYVAKRPGGCNPLSCMSCVAGDGRLGDSTAVQRPSSYSPPKPITLSFPSTPLLLYYPISSPLSLIKPWHGLSIGRPRSASFSLCMVRSSSQWARAVGLYSSWATSPRAPGNRNLASPRPFSCLRLFVHS